MPRRRRSDGYGALDVLARENAGFREVGTERLGTRCRDGAHDAVIFDLLATDPAVRVATGSTNAG